MTEDEYKERIAQMKDAGDNMLKDLTQATQRIAQLEQRERGLGKAKQAEMELLADLFEQLEPPMTDRIWEMLAKLKTL